MSRKQRLGLVLLLGLAALVRLLLVVSLEDRPYFYDPVVDSAAYDEWAQEIAHRDAVGARAFYQDPLYPYFLAAIYKTRGRDLLFVRLVQLVVGVAGCWMLFEAARRMSGAPAAFVTLAIAALYKPFAFYDTALLKEFLAVVLVEAALLCWTIERRWSWLGAGLALGLAVLVRANLLLVVLALCGFLALRRRWAPAGWVAAGAVLAIAPVTVRNAIVAKDFVLTTYQFGPNLYIGNHPGNRTGRYVPPPFLTAAAPEFEEREFRAEAERMSRRALRPSEVSSYWTDRTRAELDTGRFLRLTVRRLVEYVNAYEVPDNYNYYFLERFSWVLRLPLPGFWLAAPLAAAGMVFAWRERARWSWLYVFVAVYFASIAPFFVFARYRLPVIPALLLFAGMGAVGLAGKFRWPAVAAAVLVLVQSAIPIGPRGFDAAHYNLGLHHYRAGRPAAAAAELEKVAHVKNAQWIYLRGLAYEEAARPEKALEAFFEAARLDPSSADAAIHLARAYRAVEALEEAERWYAETIRRSPKSIEARLELGRVRLERKDWAGAMEAFDSVPTWEGRLEKARLYARLGMWPAAAEEAGRVLRQVPGHREAAAILEEARRKR